MSDFSAKFLREGRKFFPAREKRAVHLAAFGKHPGWDDHMADLGLETETLLMAKQILYAEGIGGLVNSGAWENLDPATRLAGFKHLFLWSRGDAFLVGRMWASRDGKRRDKYPMVLCGQCEGLPLSKALPDLLRLLEVAERDCQEAKTSEAVQTAVARARAELRQRFDLNAAEAAPSELRHAALLEELAAPGDDETLLRILYHLRTQMPYNLAKPDGSGEWPDRAGQIRLPAALDLPAETLLFWLRSLEGQFGRKVPILLLLPLGEPWLDALVGRPASVDFLGLRAAPPAMALASDVPHEIDASFRSENAAVLEAMRTVREDPVAAEDSGTEKKLVRAHALEDLNFWAR